MIPLPFSNEETNISQHGDTSVGELGLTVLLTSRPLLEGVEETGRGNDTGESGDIVEEPLAVEARRARVLRHVKGDLDVARCIKVVDFGWFDNGYDGNEIGGVAEIAIMQEELDGWGRRDREVSCESFLFFFF